MEILYILKLAAHTVCLVIGIVNVKCPPSPGITSGIYILHILLSLTHNLHQIRLLVAPKEW